MGRFLRLAERQRGDLPSGQCAIEQQSAVCLSNGVWHAQASGTRQRSLGANRAPVSTLVNSGGMSSTQENGHKGGRRPWAAFASLGANPPRIGKVVGKVCRLFRQRRLRRQCRAVAPSRAVPRQEAVPLANKQYAWQASSARAGSASPVLKYRGMRAGIAELAGTPVGGSNWLGQTPRLQTAR